MLPLLIPLLGLVFWVIHVAQVMTSSRHSWARWACLGVLPASSISAYLFWTFATFKPEIGMVRLSKWNANLLANAFLGMALWFVLLALEPLLLLAGRKAGGRRRRMLTPNQGARGRVGPDW